MDRTVAVRIDRSTWPGGGALPRFPRTFMGIGSVTLNIPAVLLKIGYLTTPSSAAGVSLSEFWAWVRYLLAVTGDTDLRLTSAFANLDAHQKTILSDDFGMGVPMLWLTQALDLRLVCDGRYFLQRYAAGAGATVRRTAKRGPNKTPDFVARDGRGIWHVVECKGTQSGSGYSHTQIGRSTPRPTGGIAQKRSIVFPPGHAGQRLVCALSLGREAGPERSRLTIVDPEPEDPVVVTAGQVGLVADAAERSMIARSLRLAGFDRSAEVTAAPSGRYAYSTRDPRPRYEEERQRVVDEKRAAAVEELADLEDRRVWQAEGGDRYRGRELLFDLPRPLEIGGRRARTALVRQGVNEEVLREMRDGGPGEEPLADSRLDMRDAIGSTKVDAEDDRARLRIGRLFSSELILK